MANGDFLCHRWVTSVRLVYGYKFIWTGSPKTQVPGSPNKHSLFLLIGGAQDCWVYQSSESIFPSLQLQACRAIVVQNSRWLTGLHRVPWFHQWSYTLPPKSLDSGGEKKKANSFCPWYIIKLSWWQPHILTAIPKHSGKRSSEYLWLTYWLVSFYFIMFS